MSTEIKNHTEVIEETSIQLANILKADPSLLEKVNNLNGPTKYIYLLHLARKNALNTGHISFSLVLESLK